MGKPGIDCDDVFATITDNLQIDISKDEVFIIFYKVDKDGDGLVDIVDMANRIKYLVRI